MWPFTRKAQNRRFDRPQILEVRGGSTRLRTAKVRFASMAMAGSLTALIALFLLWRGGAWLLDQLVFENPTFSIITIEARSDGVIAPEQIKRWADVKEGQNLLALDLARIKRDLELVPMIQSVAVERLLPQTLRIRVFERVPVAQVMQPLGPGVRDPVVFTLDARGVVMLPVAPSQRAVAWSATNEFLPVITGVNYVELRPGRPVESLQIKAALRLIAEFETSPMAGIVDLRWIDLSSPEVMTVTTGQGIKVTFGMTNLDHQLRRWRKAYDYVRSQGKALEKIDLSVANNIPFTTVDAAALPPVQPKPVKAVRTNLKKKNV